MELKTETQHKTFIPELRDTGVIQNAYLCTKKKP